MALCAALLPQAAEAEEVHIGQLIFHISNSEATLTKASPAASGTLTVAANVTAADGRPCPVRHLGYGAFQGCSALTDIELPQTLRRIDDDAFRGCSSLKSLLIPAGVESIGSGLAAECPNLATIAVADGNQHYQSKDGLLLTADGTELVCCPEGKSGRLTLPAGLTRIDYRVFNGCTKITDIDVPAGNSAYKSEDGLLLTADGKALVRCPEGKSGRLTLPAGLLWIDRRVVLGCSKLTDIDVPAGNSKYKSVDGLLLTADGQKLVCCPEGKSGRLTLPAGLTKIDKMAFHGCSKITDIDVPAGNSAYKSVDGLLLTADGAKLVCCPEGKSGRLALPAGLTSIGGGVFNDRSKITDIDVPAGNSAYKSVDGLLLTADGTELVRCPEGKSGRLTLPASLTSIGENAFDGCSKLTDIDVPAGNRAYKSVYGLLLTADGKELVRCPEGKSGRLALPAGLNSIGQRACAACAELTVISLPKGLNSIGVAAFQGCSGLTAIWLPASLTAISHWAFGGCRRLASIELPARLNSIGEQAFFNCGGLTSLTLPEGLTSIGGGAFMDCGGLSSITLPMGLTTLGSMAFGGCNRLTTITLPAGLTSIDSFWTLTDSPNLTKVHIVSPSATQLSEQEKAAYVALLDLPKGATVEWHATAPPAF